MRYNLYVLCMIDVEIVRSSNEDISSLPPYIWNKWRCNTHLCWQLTNLKPENPLDNLEDLGMEQKLLLTFLVRHIFQHAETRSLLYWPNPISQDKYLSINFWILQPQPRPRDVDVNTLFSTRKEFAPLQRHFIVDLTSHVRWKEQREWLVCRFF